MKSNISLRNIRYRAGALALAASIGLTASAAFACTGIVLHSKDGGVVPARTLEFAFDIQSNILAVPAGTQIETLAVDPKEKGFTFTAKYGFLGANALGYPIVVDGINTEGLYFGAFYFAGEANYPKVTEKNRSKAVSSEELGNWVLGQFKTVEEVRAALSNIEVVGTTIDAIKSSAPFHFSVVDAQGGSIVIQITPDGTRIFDNKVNAVTNNPRFDWHLTNLRNYIGLQAENRDAVKIGDVSFSGFGQGTGMGGLPGDFSSTSRFVRAVAFVATALPIPTSSDGVFQAFHILNAFDIPKGAIRDTGPDGVHTDYTVWTSAADLAGRAYYFKTFKTQSIEKIDVRAAVSNLKKPTVIKMESGYVARDRTGDFSQQ